jgi:signal peptidase I
MQPAANPGDAFITIDQNASTLKVGDIVTLRAEKTETFFAHRIIEIREQSGLLRIVTKGDSNQLSEEDPYMVAGNVEVPKTIFKVKWIGHVLVYLTSVQGRESALSLIVIANIIALMLFIFRKKISETVSRAEIVYRDLFRESRESQEVAKRRADTYKDLYEQSRSELQSMKEHEYAESNK